MTRTVVLGEFCDAPGRSSFRGLCAEGWYCTSCSWSEKPGSASELPYNGEEKFLISDEFDSSLTELHST